MHRSRVGSPGHNSCRLGRGVAGPGPLRTAARPEPVIEEPSRVLGDERRGDREFERGDGEDHAARETTPRRDAEREVELAAVERVEQREPTFRPQEVERVVGRNPDPDVLEVAEVDRVDEEEHEDEEVVERLAMGAEGGVDVGKERAEGDGGRDGEDGPDRREVPRGVGEVGEADAQHHRVEDVAFLVHRVFESPDAGGTVNRVGSVPPRVERVEGGRERAVGALRLDRVSVPLENVVFGGRGRLARTPRPGVGHTDIDGADGFLVGAAVGAGDAGGRDAPGGVGGVARAPGHLGSHLGTHRAVGVEGFAAHAQHVRFAREE